MQPDSVFQLATAVFKELGTVTPQSVTRTILMENGRSVGQRFRCGNLQAILLLDSGQIKFYNAEGELLREVSLAELLNREAA